jgi:3-phenylpropionate/cinnamic acid dioxygenase small subunit
LTDQERVDRADIGDVLVRYATGIDRRDWSLFRSCFIEDCQADYGDIGTWRSADEITDWMRASHEPMGHTLHRITNLAVDLDGDRATARSYVDAIVLVADTATGVHAVGFYDDDLVRTDGGWRIARRRFTPVLMESVGGRSTP